MKNNNYTIWMNNHTILAWKAAMSPQNTHIWWLKSRWKNRDWSLSHTWCWCLLVQSSCCSFACILPRWHAIHRPLHLQVTNSSHILRHFRNAEMIRVKHASVAYLWFAETYNTTIFLWWLSDRIRKFAFSFLSLRNSHYHRHNHRNKITLLGNPGKQTQVDEPR